MGLRIVWLLLILTVFQSATALTNDDDNEDVSIEDTAHPKQPFYDSRYDDDDYYYKNKYKKPTISEDSIFLPHEKYCQYFYAFDGSDSYLFRCPSGYRFDAEKLQCLNSKYVSCGKRKKSVASSEEKDVRIKFKCPKWSGAHPHEYYCHLFYYCQDKKPSLMMCPPGKLFDKNKNACLAKNQVNCEKRENPYGDSEDISLPDAESDLVFQCPERAGVYPDSTYCHKYIRCWYGLGEIYVCPKGKLYDEDLKKCRPKNSVYCYNKINPYAVRDDEEPTVVDEIPNFFCPSNWGRYPHEECQMFYQCEGGYARLFICPHGKMFDSESTSCKMASEVTCNKETKEEDNDDDFVCPTREGIFKDEEDCGSYYKCRNGKAQHLKCPEGELFDADWKSCSDENQVTCGDRSLPGDEEDNDEESVIDPNPGYNCEKRHGRFTHKEYCNWFYHCKDGRSSVRSCRNGKYYDSYKGNCYETVDCGARKPKPDHEITTQRPREFSCPFKTGKFPDPKDCGAYYVCEKYKHKHLHCPKGRLFHDKWLSCSDENSVTCGSRTHPDVDPEDRENKIIDPNPRFECKAKYGQYDHDEYCDWYYNCHDSKPTIRECRRGKYYDSHRRRCHHSREVSCGNRRKPEEREDPMTTEKTISTRQPEFRCPESNGKFPHWRDCSKFFECKKWSHKEQKCPKYKLFDSGRQSCEDDDHVICNERIHPDMDPDEPEDKVIDPNPKFYCKSNYGRFTHDEYCHWYYNCHNKKATVRECKHGKYYDSKRRRCYSSKEVSCEGRKQPGDNENLRTTTEGYITTAPFQCPKGEGKYPHERDCGKYYDCKKWRYTLYNCPKRQLFNIKAKKCENEDKVTCGGRIHPEDDPDVPEDRTVDPNPDFACPDNFGRYRHGNCDWYYHCRDRRPSIRECQSGKYYDRHSKKCKNSVDVDCDDRIRPEDRVTYRPEKSTTSSQPTSTTIKERITTTMRPTAETRTKEKDLITTVSYPDENTKASEPSSPETTKISFKPKEPTIPTEEPITEIDDNPDIIIDREPNYDCSGDEGDFAHDSYCHYYYSCKGNKVTLRECPEGKYFDIERGYCEDWYMVTCGDRLTPEELGSTFDDFQSTPYIERRSTFIPKSTTQEPVSEKPKFDCVRDGLYPHEINCGKYYLCTNGVAEEKVCPENQLYDVEKNSCSDEDETNCGKRIHPNDDPDNPDKVPDKVIDPNPEFNCTSRHGCFSHEMFCKWYYYCHDKRPEVRECSGDQYFDSVRNKCLEWWMVICDKQIVPEDTTLMPTTVSDITSSENTQGITESTSNDKFTDVTDSRTRTTVSDERTPSTEGDQYTKFTTNDRFTRSTDATSRVTDRDTFSTRKDDRSTYTTPNSDKTRVTDSNKGSTTEDNQDTESTTADKGIGSTGARTISTDSNTGKFSTTDEDKITKTTSNDRVTSSTKGRTRTTDSGRSSSTREDQGTGSTQGRTRTTDSGRRTHSTREGDQVTGSTERRTRTTDSSKRPRSTTQGDQSTRSTPRDRVTGSTAGKTTGNEVGTSSTRDGSIGTRSTPSERVTNSRDGKTTESGKGTRSTREDDQDTRTTSSGRVTGSTEKEPRTTDNDRGTRSTREKNKNTGSTTRDRITGSTEGRTTDKITGTRVTRDRGSTPSGKFTSSTEGRTRTTDNGRGTRSTRQENRSTSTGDDQGTRSTPSGRVTGSTERKPRTTDNDRGTQSTREENKNTGSTPSDRITDSTDGKTTDKIIGTRVTTVEDRESTPSGKVTGSTEGRTRTTDNGRGTRSTREDGKNTMSTPGDRVTDSTRGRTTESGRKTRSTRGDRSTKSKVTGSTEGRTRTTDNGRGTRSTRQENRSTSTRDDQGTRSTPSDRVTGSTERKPRTTDNDSGTQSTREENKNTGSTPSDKITGSTEGRTRTTDNGRGTRSTREDGKNTMSTPGDRVTDSTRGRTTESDRKTRSTRGDRSTKSKVTGSTEGRTRTTDNGRGTISTIERNIIETTTGISTTDKTIRDKCKEEDGDFQHPDDCSKYYTCKDGEYTLNICPPGMLFDKNLRICSREDRVDCDNRKRPQVTTDDCDEWLRTSTIADEHTTQTRKGTDTPNIGTGGTEITSSGTNGDIATTTSQNIGSTTKYVSDETNSYFTGTDSPNPSDSSTTSEPTKDAKLTETPTDVTSDSTSSDSPSSKTDNIEENKSTKTSESDKSESTVENFTNSPASEITTDSSEKSTVSSSNEVTENNFTTDEHSSEEPKEKTEKTRNTNSETEETTKISVTETGITDVTMSTDDNSGKTEITSTTKGSDQSEKITDKTVTMLKPTISTILETEENTDSSDIPASTKDNTENTETPHTTRDNESDETTTKSVTILKPTVSSISDSRENTDSTDNEPNTSTTITNDNSKESKETEESTIKTVTMIKPTLSTISETEENTDSSDSPTSSKDNTENTETPYTTKDNELDETTAKSVTISKPTVSTISDSRENTDSTDKESDTSTTTTNDNSMETTDTSESVSTRSTESETNTNPSGKNTNTEGTDSTTVPESKSTDVTSKTDNPISETTTNDGTTEDGDDSLETRIISEKTPSEPEASTFISTQSTKDSINTKEISSTTDNLSTDDNRTEYPSTTESKVDISSTENPGTESNTSTDDKVSKVISTTTIKDNEKSSVQTITTSKDTVSTISETETTAEHTTMHPCVTHTHSTVIPPEPTKPDCDNDDIDCIEKKTGDVEKWYKCPSKQGHFPHPQSNRIFIKCKNWKPKIKRCGRKEIFSTKRMDCIRA